ncbi:MAG: MATE family efflux transporter [Bariatricus sp.]
MTYSKEVVDLKFAKSAYWNFLLWGICASLGMTISTFVDALLIGNLVGSQGLAVTNLSTPVFLAYALFGLTLGVGSNVYIGRFLGSSDLEKANRAFHAVLSIGLGISICCLIPALCLRKELLGFLGAGGELYYLAEQYLLVVFCSAPVFIMYHIFSVSVRTDGDPKLAATASAVVIFTNLTLDILFMKVLNWGIIGASSSLCIAEGLGLIVLLSHFLKKQSLLRLGIVVPSLSEIRNFTVNGFGVGSAYIFQGLVMLVFNMLLLLYGREQGVLQVAVFGVIYTISMAPFAVFDGAGNALAVVTSIFAGERDCDSMIVILRQGMKVAVISGGIFSVLCILFAEQLAGFFGLDLAMVPYAVPAIRIFAVSIMFTGINMVATAFWQAIGRAKLAGAMSTLRNFLLMLLLGGLLIARWQIKGLALTYILVEGIGTLFAAFIHRFRSSYPYISEKYRAVGNVFENHYPIHAESVEQISSDLDAICEKWEISPKQSFFIHFIAEELLLNIIKFGLKESGKERYVAIKLLENGDEYIIRIRDNVHTYNPFDSSGDEIDNGVLKLITKKAKYYNYQRKLIFNYLYLII